MKNTTLLALLVDLSDSPAYKLADKFGISAASLSRHCSSLLNRRSTLDKAAQHFTTTIGAEVDSNLLTTKLDARALVGLAIHLRGRKLRGLADANA